MPRPLWSRKTPNIPTAKVTATTAMKRTRLAAAEGADAPDVATRMAPPRTPPKVAAPKPVHTSAKVVRDGPAPKPPKPVKVSPTASAKFKNSTATKTPKGTTKVSPTASAKFRKGR